MSGGRVDTGMHLRRGTPELTAQVREIWPVTWSGGWTDAQQGSLLRAGKGGPQV